MLTTLFTTDIIGGWVTKLIELIEKNIGTHYLKGIELKRKNNREVRHDVYVSEMRDISAIKVDLKYRTINNKHKRFIFKIYFVVIRFCCNYQYFRLHAYLLPTIIIYNYYNYIYNIN